MSSPTTFGAKMLAFVRYFQVEIFYFVLIFSLSVEDVTVTLLAQDKICMRRFGNRASICANLSAIRDDDADDDNHSIGTIIIARQKDQILAQVTNFNFYQSLIYTIPTIVSSMFLSSWADRHHGSTKKLLCLSAAAAAIESIYMLFCAIYFDSNVNLMLLAFIFYPLVGGSQSLGMAAITYLSVTTDTRDRVKRFAIFELTFIVAYPAGVFVGGVLIQSTVSTQFAISNGMLHNYHYVLAVAAGGKIVALIYAAAMRFKSRPPTNESPSQQSNREASASDEISPLIQASPSSSSSLDNSSAILDRSSKRNNSSNLFVWRRMADSWQVCIARRPHHAHRFIWLLLTCAAIVAIVNRSSAVLMFQFVQKLYGWNAGTYSSVNSTLYLAAHLFGLLILTPIFTKCFLFTDSTLLVIGLASLIGQNFIRGTVIRAVAFFASYFVGSMTSIIAVAIRVKLSRLSPLDEQNRIFGVLTLLESIAPLIGVAISTAIFTETISRKPGLVFQLFAVVLLVPLSISLYIAFRKSPLSSVEKSIPTIIDQNNNEEEENNDNNEEAEHSFLISSSSTSAYSSSTTENDLERSSVRIEKNANKTTISH